MQLPSNGPNKLSEREDLARDWAEHPFNGDKTYGKSSRMRLSAATGQTEGVGAPATRTRRFRPCQRPQPRTASGHRPRKMLPTRLPSLRQCGSWCKRTRRRSMVTTTFRQAHSLLAEMAVVRFTQLLVVGQAPRVRHRRYQRGRDRLAPETRSPPSQSKPHPEPLLWRVDGHAARVLCIIPRASSAAMPAALTGRPPRPVQPLRLQSRNGHVVLVLC